MKNRAVTTASTPGSVPLTFLAVEILQFIVLTYYLVQDAKCPLLFTIIFVLVILLVLIHGSGPTVPKQIALQKQTVLEASNNEGESATGRL